MNLLYISNLSNNIDSGLNWSVPASVKAQQQYDNVLWVDLTRCAFQEHWRDVSAYHNIQEYGGKLRLEAFPEPFNNPDYVIFEGFYYIEHVIFARKLKHAKVPYIIIPRGSLTATAFKNGGWIKRIKKRIAHKCCFDRFIRDAAAIQYLTQAEQDSSENRFNKKSFVIPNGVVIPQQKKEQFSDGIKGVFIGRQDIFQKGLDLLFDAISELEFELRAAHFHLDIYGPPRYDVGRVSALVKEKGIGDLVVNHARGVRGLEKQTVLLSADLFFLTSRFEGHPMGLIEALSYGIPSFITRGANMHDEIMTYDAGWVCETSKESIVAALQTMLNEQYRFPGKGLKARLLASNYDWSVLAGQFHSAVVSLKKKH